MTATTFCIALMSAQSRPSNGIDRTCSMIPPVTTLAVPIVSRTKPQKMPACISPARQSLNILVWMNAYWIRPTNRRGMSANGLGPSARAAREDAQVARHREQRRSPPRPRTAGRPAGSTGPRRRARTASSSAAPARCRPLVIERPGQGLERVIEHRLDGRQRFDRALRAAGQVDDQRPADDPDDAARQVGERGGSTGPPRASPRRAPGPRSRWRPGSPAA